MSNPELEREFDPKWFEPAPNQTEYTQGFYAGQINERTRIAELIKRQVCFDALADHDAMETFRMAHPEIVGRCAHHGGKCTDLLLLISKLEAGA
jgi:hypothetical protein